jgi:hypothetical protein
MADLNRLGGRDAYRLGRLRSQGIAKVAPPAPFRPWFNRPRHRGRASAWLLGCLLGTGAILATAAAGLWFGPFVVGLLAGLVSRPGGWRMRVAAPVAATMAVAGWGIALWWPALHGQPSGATARVIAALAGLPPHAAAGIALTLLIALAQAVVGAWLGRVLVPRRAR